MSRHFRGRIPELVTASLEVWGPRPRDIRRALTLDDPETDLVFDTVREQVAEALRPGVFAEWSDPRERWR